MIRYEGNRVILSGEASCRLLNRILGRISSCEQDEQQYPELSNIQTGSLPNGFFAVVPDLIIPDI